MVLNCNGDCVVIIRRTGVKSESSGNELLEEMHAEFVELRGGGIALSFPVIICQDLKTIGALLRLLCHLDLVNTVYISASI